MCTFSSKKLGTHVRHNICSVLCTRTHKKQSRCWREWFLLLVGSLIPDADFFFKASHHPTSFGVFLRLHQSVTWRLVRDSPDQRITHAKTRRVNKITFEICLRWGSRPTRRNRKKRENDLRSDSSGFSSAKGGVGNRGSSNTANPAVAEGEGLRPWAESRHNDQIASTWPPHTPTPSPALTLTMHRRGFRLSLVLVVLLCCVLD